MVDVAGGRTDNAGTGADVSKVTGRAVAAGVDAPTGGKTAGSETGVAGEVGTGGCIPLGTNGRAPQVRRDDPLPVDVEGMGLSADADVGEVSSGSADVTVVIGAGRWAVAVAGGGNVDEVTVLPPVPVSEWGT